MESRRIPRGVKLIPLFKVFMSDKVVEEIEPVLKSGYIGQGPKVEEFEKLLKDYFETDYLLAVNSCTNALQLATHLIKPQDGWEIDDEIIVTPLTCFATIAPLISSGVKVRWADIDPNTCNIDLLDVERKLTKNTKAVMVVHWSGYPVDLCKLEEIQNKYENIYGKKLEIIEDCAHCWDSKFDGKMIGNSGNLCCFSFQAIKFLTTADGGMLILPNAETYNRAKLLRWFGLDRDAGASFRCIQNIAESGFKYQTNDVLTSIGISNFPYISENVNKHKQNAEFYFNSLNSCPGVTLLERNPKSEGSYWIFTMKVERRDEFIKHMESNGIVASSVHARCDKHSCMKDSKSMLPNMDYLEKVHVSIPCGWWVSEEDREYIVSTIKKGW